MAYDELHGLDSPIFYGGSNPAHVETAPIGRITAPPVTVEGKQETLMPVRTSGDKPIEKAVPSGTPYFNKVEQWQNVSTAGTESGRFQGGVNPAGGQPYQFHTDLPPVEKWGDPEYKSLIENEIRNTNAFTNEPSVMRQGAMEGIAAGETSPTLNTQGAKEAWLTANPSPILPDVPVAPKADYAKPKMPKK